MTALRSRLLSTTCLPLILGAGIALGRTGFLQDFGGGSGLEPLQGVAPAATLIGVKVLGATGSGTSSDVIAGIAARMP